MHVVFRESHGLEDTDTPYDPGQTPADLVMLSFSDSDLGAFAAGWHRGGGMMAKAATNGDGRLTLQEFQAHALARFDRADADSDGTVTQAERKAAREARRAQMAERREARRAERAGQ